VLLTRSPLRQTQFLRTGNASLDLHALGAPPAFILSQDQTLQHTHSTAAREGRVSIVSEGFGLGPGVVRTPSLIAHVIVTPQPCEGCSRSLASASSPPLRGDEAPLAVCRDGFELCSKLCSTEPSLLSFERSSSDRKLVYTLFSCQGAGVPDFVRVVELPFGSSRAVSLLDKLPPLTQSRLRDSREIPHLGFLRPGGPAIVARPRHRNKTT
jgi:hypothetical protein